MKRKAELTFQHNRKRGRYGWLRLTPAYSLKMVQRYLPEEIMGKVLDPFCGTGTTPLYAAYQGLASYALELNPFLVWFARVKTATYDERLVEELYAARKWILDRLDYDQLPLADPPPIRNIERWWHAPTLRFLRIVKQGIEDYRDQVPSEDVIDLGAVTLSYQRGLKHQRSP